MLHTEIQIQETEGRRCIKKPHKEGITEKCKILYT